MDPQRERLLQLLLGAARAMPKAQLRQVTDFADFLKAKHGSSRADAGSAEALLRHAGSLRFRRGEMDRILSDISEMRHMDLEQDA